MNLFMVDERPGHAASMLCDQHVPKMILETAQILDGGTRHYLTNLNPTGGPYDLVKIPKTQLDNPVIRSAKHRNVYEWALCHLSGLLTVFHLRWGHPHQYDKDGLLDVLTARYGAVRSHMTDGPYYLATDGAFLPVADGQPTRYTNDLDVATRVHRLNYARHKLTYGRKGKPVTWRKPSCPPGWLISLAYQEGYEVVNTDFSTHFEKVSA